MIEDTPVQRTISSSITIIAIALSRYAPSPFTTLKMQFGSLIALALASAVAVEGCYFSITSSTVGTWRQNRREPKGRSCSFLSS
jgi:hypothetical protein